MLERHQIYKLIALRLVKGFYLCLLAYKVVVVASS